MKQSYINYGTLFYVITHINGKMFNESSTQIQIKVDQKKKTLFN